MGFLQTSDRFQNDRLAGPCRTKKNKKFLLLYVEVDRPQGKIGKLAGELVNSNQFFFPIGEDTTRKSRNNTRQIRISQTATGCEYFRP